MKQEARKEETKARKALGIDLVTRLRNHMKAKEIGARLGVLPVSVGGWGRDKGAAPSQENIAKMQGLIKIIEEGGELPPAPTMAKPKRARRTRHVQQISGGDTQVRITNRGLEIFLPPQQRLQLLRDLAKVA